MTEATTSQVRIVTEEAVPRITAHAAPQSGQEAVAAPALVSPALVSPAKVRGAIAALVIAPFLFCLLLLLPREAMWVSNLLLSAIAAALAFFLMSRPRGGWTAPVVELTNTVREVRDGKMPIEALSEIPIGLEPIAAEVQLILRELRRQKQALAELNAEVRGRVANRTSALERKVETLKQQATRDALTGLYNRRMLDQMLPQLVNQAVAEGAALSLLMIDVDYFKDLNDTLGHAAGDEVLKSIGEIVHSTIREADLGFRIGGDEFVVILPGCPKEPADAIAGRLRSLVQGLTSTLKVVRRPRLSIGVCSLADLHDRSADNLLRRADELLYECKSARKTPAKPVASPVGLVI